MSVFDFCPFTYAPLATLPLCCFQSVVLLFDAVVTTNRHVPPRLPSRPGVCHYIHCIRYACVAWLYHLIVTSGHAGKPSVSWFGDIMPAVNMAWVGLQWAMKHEALDACSSVLSILISTAPRLGKASRLVADKNSDARAGMVCCGLGSDLTLGHQQLVTCELPFGNRGCG